MLDWSAIHYDPIYAMLGDADAVITPKSTGISATIVAIEKTVGETISLGEDQLSLQGVKAAAAVRMSELNGMSLTRDDLRDGKLLVNGKTWRIHSTKPAPGPGGERAGELFLYLLELTP